MAKNGQLVLYKHDGIAPEDGDAVRVSIRQVQMEQDTARTVAQSPSQVLIDYNRVSHPLIEIITMPEIHHASTAAAFVKKVQLLLRAVDAVSTGMEHGGLRVDVNVSVRDRQKLTCPGSTNEYYGMAGLGQRTEIKNLNSFKAIEDAINAERDRQVGLLEGGGVVEGESRNWNLRSGRSTKMRSKAGEVDYRYMPDPDLGEVLIAQVMHCHFLPLDATTHPWCFLVYH